MKRVEGVVQIEGVVQKLGLEGGLWAIIDGSGRQFELIDAPEALKSAGRRARVWGTGDAPEVSIGMVGGMLQVSRFEWID